MPKEIKCTNPECQSSNIDDRRAEGNIGAKEAFKKLPTSKESISRYKCRDYGNEFDEC